MGVLTRASILQADDMKREEVQVPEWGGSVFVRTMTGAERDRFEGDQHQSESPFEKVRARLAVATVCDESGKLLFTEADVDALAAKSAAALDRILPVASRLSGITKKDMEELEKNSSTIPSASTPSDSPSV